MGQGKRSRRIGNPLQLESTVVGKLLDEKKEGEGQRSQGEGHKNLRRGNGKNLFGGEK